MKVIRQLTHFDLDGISSIIPIISIYGDDNIDYKYKLCTNGNVEEKLKLVLEDSPSILFITDLSLTDNMVEMIKMYVSLNNYVCVHIIDHHATTFDTCINNKLIGTPNSDGVATGRNMTINGSLIGTDWANNDCGAVIAYKCFRNTMEKFIPLEKINFYDSYFEFVNEFDCHKLNSSGIGEMLNSYLLSIDNNPDTYLNAVHSWNSYMEMYNDILPIYKIANEIYKSIIDASMRNIKDCGDGIQLNRSITVDGKVPNAKIGVILLGNYVNGVNDVCDDNIDYGCIIIVYLSTKRVSVRASNDNNISARSMCELFGGGGHLKASGFSYNSISELCQMLDTNI